MSKLDKYQKYGVFMLLLSLFFMAMFAKGIERVLYISGLTYSLVFIFHRPLERLVANIKRPLFGYGLFVVINGLIVEVLAYINNMPKIARGEKVFLFSGQSLGLDLLISLPYYISLAVAFAYVVKKYRMTTFQLGFIIWLFWAISVDEWSHVLSLFAGGIAGIIGFIMAGIIMLFTLHSPIVLFENQLEQKYPDRQETWKKYFTAFVLQIPSIIIVFIIAFTRCAILKLPC